MAEGGPEQSVGNWAENGRFLAEGNGASEKDAGGMECETNSWQEVAKKKKRKKVTEAESTDSSEGEGIAIGRGKASVEYKVSIQLSQEDHTFKEWNPLLLTRCIHKHIGEVKSMRVTGNGKLMIFCRDKAQQGKAALIQMLDGKKVQGSIPGGNMNIKGVISGVPIGVTMEEVKSSVKGGKIEEAKRFRTVRNGEFCDSLTVLLTFSEGRLPAKVYLGYFSYEVRPYVPPPLRCYKCQRFGHVAAVCRGTQRCGRCAGEHAYGMCGPGVKPKCCNCGGEHSAAYKGCEASRKAEAAQRERPTRGVTYAEAVSLTVNTAADRGRDEQGLGVAAPVGVNTRMTDETLIVSKTDFVLFMVDVVNCAAQTDKRTERIKIIVRSAERFLGIKDLKWEVVNEMLNASPREGGGP